MGVENIPTEKVSTHSRPKAAGKAMLDILKRMLVSTHSRPKAAGFPIVKTELSLNSFNTQPPEGGWAGRFH